MELFISWSGERSRAIAEVIREWVPCVIQAVKPYFSPDDINKGQRWSSEISNKLEASKVGVVILTPANLDAPWLMFEAGALSKSLETSRVCPLLFGVTPADVIGPLVQFQCSEFSETEAFKLLHSINDALGDEKLEDKILRNSFDVFWPILESRIKLILDAPDISKEKSNVRNDRDILEEILRLTRKTAYSHARTISPTKAFEKFQQKKPVTFDPESGVVSFWSGGSEVYDFSVNRISSGSELLDWFFQVSNKGWCTGEHLKAFLDCIEEITDLYFESNAQGVFCPGGINKSIDWGNALPRENSDI
ncbi:toll/interleukin-1 receptor domain-containing protein [Serratia marcescens]|nr:toll/interleukin-1 receptor domain-containing protein [Serratia marcescens]MBH2865737.1 toll/interleukin-1 receptor domain-containing protein [Serratia marcescens]